jgi:hypothetical protein
MPNYTANPNDPNTLTCSLSRDGSATTSITVSGVDALYVHTPGRGLNATDGWVVGAAFTVGAGTNTYEITAIEENGPAESYVFTVTPAFAAPESSGDNSGHTVTRYWKGTHKSYKEHLRLRNLGHI